MTSRYRPPYTGDWRYRRPYRSAYRACYPYIYSGWAAPYFVGYPYDIGDDDSSGQQNNAGAGYDMQPDEQGPPYADYPPYPPPYPAQMQQSQPPALENEDAVTLVFKDGRSPEKIHNYVLTSKTLYVGDQRREIPVDELDLTATAKANHEAGVDFHLPSTSN